MYMCVCVCKGHHTTTTKAQRRSRGLVLLFL